MSGACHCQTFPATGMADICLTCGGSLDGRYEIERIHEEKINAVYDERNRCVAAMTCMAMTRGWVTWLGKHEPANDPMWDKEWMNVVFIDLPTGQVSWHIHDRDLPLFAHLPVRPDGPSIEGDITKWDGHSTEEKYKRLERLAEPIRRFPWLYRP